MYFVQLKCCLPIAYALRTDLVWVAHHSRNFKLILATVVHGNIWKFLLFFPHSPRSLFLWYIKIARIYIILERVKNESISYYADRFRIIFWILNSEACLLIWCLPEYFSIERAGRTFWSTLTKFDATNYSGPGECCWNWLQLDHFCEHSWYGALFEMKSLYGKNLQFENFSTQVTKC